MGRKGNRAKQGKPGHKHAQVARRSMDGAIPPTEHKINLSGIARPNRMMVSDWAALSRLGSTYKIVFGQRALNDDSRLTAAMSVQISRSDVFTWLSQEGTKRFHDNNMVHLKVERSVLRKGDLAATASLESSQLSHQKAVIIIAARVGSMVEMSFYDILPSLAHEVQQTNKQIQPKDVQPVVTVQLPLEDVAGLVDSLYEEHRTFVQQGLAQEES